MDIGDWTTSIHEELRSHALTPREEEIVLQLLQGLSNKEIASNCYITEQTVKDHLKHIFSKLGVHHRAMLISTLLAFRTAKDFPRAPVQNDSKQENKGSIRVSSRRS